MEKQEEDINKEISTLINDSDILGIEDQELTRDWISFLLTLKPNEK